MHRDGHIGLTLIVFSILYYVLNSWNFKSILILLIAVIFSTFPDYDIKILSRRTLIRKIGLLFLTLSLLLFFLQIPATTYLSVIFLFLSLIFVMLSFIHHRGITHTLTFAFVCGTLMGFITLEILGDFYVGFIGAFFGVVLHIFGDLLTYTSFSPLYPFSNRKISLKLFRSSNKLVNRSLITMGLIALMILYKNGIVIRLVLDNLGCL